MKTVTSELLGEQVVFIDTVYSKELGIDVDTIIEGVIESVSIDTKFGAYGYVVKTIVRPDLVYYNREQRINFIIHSENTENYIGKDVSKLILS